MSRYDILIVGAGLYGATFANAAIRSGKKVLILDRRKHIGGNCYDTKKRDYYVHEYGPHIFHTNDRNIWEFVNEYATFNSFVNRPKVVSGDKIYSFPINLMTLQQLWGVKTPGEARDRLDSERRRDIVEPTNFEEAALAEVGEQLYGMFYRGYTMKQWGRDPRELPASTFRRVPVRTTFNDNYFNDRYQGIPECGYTEMISNIADGADYILGVDYDRNGIYREMADLVVYTGCVDEYFGNCFGKLEYRSLRFEKSSYNGDFQGNAIINFASPTGPTRIIEHKHFFNSKAVDSVCTAEFPVKAGGNVEPFYPINDRSNNALFDQYKMLVKKEKGTIFGGRLAEYKYYDMHQVIAKARKDAKDVLHLSADYSS